MTRDDILRMMREAGLYEPPADYYAEDLEDFAALVAEAEREACAKICDGKMDEQHTWRGMIVAQDCAAAIRARGKKP